ncbi:MAG: hypothetical protein IT438_05905 [Phycisphaerales bacterium]|nr:hypothetical protein [Phycisphaerales bacterium]
MNRSASLVVLAVVCAAFATAKPARAQMDSDRRGPDKPRTSVPADKPRKPAETKLDDPREVFGPAGSKPDATTSAADKSTGWTIVLAVFRGEEQGKLAELGAHKVQTEGRLPGAFVEKRGGATVVAYGRYDSSDAESVKEELKRIQQMEIGGQRPYEYAMLAPPLDKADPGTLPQYNLLQAHVRYGESALYTLQVGVYGRDDINQPKEADLKEVRRAAEQAALKLRQEGEEAFYYHGPRRSMVTVGVFDNKDFDPSAPTFKSARLREAMKRHPNNLYNGAGIIERRKGETQGRMQSSTLVAVPKK